VFPKAEVFAPKVFMKQDGKQKLFRIVVNKGNQCQGTMLFKVESKEEKYPLTYSFLENLPFSLGNISSAQSPA
jgi:hypothetical protein